MKFSLKVGNGPVNKWFKFWWRSRLWILIWIATLVRRALAEVCTVLVLHVANNLMLTATGFQFLAALLILQVKLMLEF